MRLLWLLESFSREAALSVLERLAEGDIVLLQDASGGGRNTADLLIEKGIEAVITDSEMATDVREHFQEKEIPVFTTRDVSVQWIDGVPFVRPGDVEVARARWAEQMKARKAERQAERLESILQEYRTERKKEQRKLRQG